MSTHAASGKRRGLTDEQIAALKEPGGARREDLFDQRERAVLRFATLLTAHPGGVEQRDLDELGEHLTAEEAFELVAVADQPVQRRAADAARLTAAVTHRRSLSR